MFFLVHILKLKGKIVEKGLTIEDLADQMNMHKSTLYRKMESQGDSFLIKEVDAIVKVLALSREEAASIFFSQFVA